MKKAQIKVGGTYSAKVNGKHTTVRVDNIRETGGVSGTHYHVTNLATGRTTVFHSAAKFREEAARDCPFAGSAESTATATPPSSEPATTEESEQRTDPQIGDEQDDTSSLAMSAVLSTPVPTDLSLTRFNQNVGFASRIAAANPTNVTRVPEVVAGYTPTDEQRAILEAVLELLSSDGPRVLVVNAGAGTGKTSTFRMMEQLLHGQIQYTAYNRDLVLDSKTKFKKAKCNTGHSLAFHPVGRDYQHRLNGSRVRSWEVAHKLGIQDYTITGEPYPVGSPEWVEAAQGAGYNDTNNPPPSDFNPAPVKTLKAAFLAGCVTQALKKFSSTADSEITTKHFKYIDGIDSVDEETGRRGRANNSAVVEYLLPFARKFWADVCDVDGVLPFTHDYYFKMWQLRSDAVIPADHIMLDEHQDTAPVFADVIRRQAATVVLVGDECQAIYKWRNAMNAADLFPDAPVLYLSQSFRFGQTVADVANSILARLEKPTKLKMRGLATIPTRVLVELPTDEYGNPTAGDVSDQHVGKVCYLYRTNAGAVARILTEYANKRYGHLVGKVDDVVKFVKGAQALQRGQRTEHPDLAVFENWTEVQEYVEEDPDGGDIKLMVKLIDTFKCEPILEALNNMPSEDRADFICSTAHKSKGREWDTVVLGSDFPPAHKMGDDDCYLLYVAATRAKLVLNLTLCAPFHTYKDKDGHEYPKIEVDFTIDMPTAADLALYQFKKLAESDSVQQSPKMAMQAAPQSVGPVIRPR